MGEKHNQKARIMQNEKPVPKIDPTAYLSPGVWVMGDVQIAKDANIWFGSVLRGDINKIEVGEGSNIQDHSVLHVTRDLPCKVGAWVTVGHRVTLHGCTVEDRCLIGMGATVLDGAVIGENSIVGAGTLVPERMQVPPNSLVFGVPGRVIRKLNEQPTRGERIARDYVEVAKQHRSGEFPPLEIIDNDRSPQ